MRGNIRREGAPGGCARHAHQGDGVGRARGRQLRVRAAVGVVGKPLHARRDARWPGARGSGRRGGHWQGAEQRRRGRGARAASQSQRSGWGNLSRPPRLSGSSAAVGTSGNAAPAVRSSRAAALARSSHVTAASGCEAHGDVVRGEELARRRELLPGLRDVAAVDERRRASVAASASISSARARIDAPQTSKPGRESWRTSVARGSRRRLRTLRLSAARRENDRRAVDRVPERYCVHGPVRLVRRQHGDEAQLDELPHERVGEDGDAGELPARGRSLAHAAIPPTSSTSRPTSASVL